MKVLASCAAEVAGALEQCSNTLLAQVLPISMFNETLQYPLGLAVITELLTVRTERDSTRL